jgi:hypothetical protein
LGFRVVDYKREPEVAPDQSLQALATEAKK